MFAKNDTTGKPKKIKIIDNFGINTSYNIFADSMRWSPVSMALRTSLFNNFNISVVAVFHFMESTVREKYTMTFAISGIISS